MMPSYLWVKLRGAAMDRVNLPFFVNLGSVLQPYIDSKVAADTRIACILAGFKARDAVRALLEEYPSLTVCQSSGEELINEVEAMFKWYQDATEEERSAQNFTTDNMFTTAIAKAKDFQVVLAAELQTFAAYQISQKGIYSTPDLIDRADNVFDEPTREALSDATRNDVNQAGRCLALDLPTASGYHVMRAAEAVLKTYCTVFEGKPKGRGWNAYVNALKKTTASPKTLAVLDQIRDLHRNPVAHPEIVLTMDEAIQLFGIAQSAILSMVGDIRALAAKKAKAASQSATGSNGP